MMKSTEIRAPQDLKDTNAFRSEVEIKYLSTDIEPRGDYNGDEDYLARLGKKQVLKVSEPD